MMRQATGILTIDTTRQGLVEIGDRVAGWVAEQGLAEGLLTIFCRHTSASLLIQENAARAVRSDIEAYFAVIAPEDPARYAHDDEGPDDMPAHLRAALTGVHLSIPLIGGRLALGTWQGIYLLRTPPPPAPAHGGTAFGGGVAAIDPRGVATLFGEWARYRLWADPCALYLLSTPFRHPFVLSEVEARVLVATAIKKTAFRLRSVRAGGNKK